MPWGIPIRKAFRLVQVAGGTVPVATMQGSPPSGKREMKTPRSFENAAFFYLAEKPGFEPGLPSLTLLP